MKELPQWNGKPWYFELAAWADAIKVAARDLARTDGTARQRYETVRLMRLASVAIERIGVTAQYNELQKTAEQEADTDFQIKQANAFRWASFRSLALLHGEPLLDLQWSTLFAMMDSKTLDVTEHAGGLLKGSVDVSASEIAEILKVDVERVTATIRELEQLDVITHVAKGNKEHSVCYVFSFPRSIDAF